MRQTVLKISLLTVILMSCTGLWAQLQDEEFGKNRVQYHDNFDNWWMYESDNFITYWYGKGRNIGEVAMQLAEIDYDEIVNTIEHRINEKIEIIVYVDLTDLKQSNLGSEEIFTNSAERTKIIGHKLFVHFNGSHQDLRKQIREGVSAILIDAMLYGSNLQEMVQNAVLLNVPKWFRDGLIDYIRSEWDSEVNQELRKILLSEEGRESSFGALANLYPRTIGHAFWYFLSETYGRATIANLLYLTRINRDLEHGFLYVLGTEPDRLEEEWRAFYDDLINEPLSGQLEEDLFTLKKRRKLTAVEYNNPGSALAYVTNEMGKVRVYIRSDGKEDLVLKDGYCNLVQDPDYNYPIIDWTPDGRYLFIVYERRDVVWLRRIDFRSGESMEQKMPFELQRIYDASAINGRELIFAATDNGYSDLFRYYTRTRQFEKLTDDYHDDLEVEYYEDENFTGVLFLSNRPNEILIPREYIDTILPLSNPDVFFYDLDRPESPLARLTDNDVSNKKEILLLPGDRLAFLSDKSGVWNRRILDLQSAFKEMSLGMYVEYGFDGLLESQYPDNIQLHAYNAATYRVLDVFHSFEKAVIERRMLNSRLIRDSLEVPEVQPVADDDNAIDSAKVKYDLNYSQFFETPYENPEFILEEEEAEEGIDWEDDAIADYKYHSSSHGDVPKFVFSQAVASRLRFRLDNFNTNLDNSLLFGGLDTYAGTKQGFENPPLGILLKANLKDIFEDYEIDAGARITTSFNGSEYFILLKDKKRRIDKHYALYRRGIKNLINEGPYANRRGRNITFIGLFQARYPFDVYRSLRGTVTFRNDKFNVLAVNQFTLEAPSLDEQRLGLKLEYVFDNTIDVDINIKNGTRYKVFTELVKQLSIDFDPFNLEANKGFMTVMGVDFRHYQPFLKHSIFAFRLNGATSLGSEKILFYAGGMRNWLFPEFNNTTITPTEDNFAYQTIATNLRGFRYNIRNGGSYVLINNEIRIPIVKYLTKRKIKFTPIQQLQVSGFFDMGLAWLGSSPLDRDNPANSVVLQNPSVTLDINLFKDPLIMGYGWGLRTLLFGYYVKFDYAWGIETRTVQDPVYYISLGLDF
ncbi:MAG: hypothetical protein R3275_04105 [Saprospiraceae bacterium]|nr:hypothetical protein [Saprospiraceae bacterium]